MVVPHIEALHKLLTPDELASLRKGQGKSGSSARQEHLAIQLNVRIGEMAVPGRVPVQGEPGGHILTDPQTPVLLLRGFAGASGIEGAIAGMQWEDDSKAFELR